MLRHVAWAEPIEAPSVFVAAQLTVQLHAGAVLLTDLPSGFSLDMSAGLIRRVAPSVAIIGLAQDAGAASVRRFLMAGGDLLLTQAASPASRPVIGIIRSG